MDIVRILRVIEYTGPRDLIEDQIAKSLHGEKRVEKLGGRAITIRVATLGAFPEILGVEPSPEADGAAEVPA